MIPLTPGVGPEWSPAGGAQTGPTTAGEERVKPDAARKGSPDDEARIRKAAETFESLFVEMLMQRMRSAQLDEGFFGEGAGASTYEGMFERFLSDSITEGSPLGIADMLVRQWSGSDDPLSQANEDLARIDRARAGRQYKDAAAVETQVPGPATDE